MALLWEARKRAGGEGSDLLQHSASPEPSPACRHPLPEGEGFTNQRLRENRRAVGAAAAWRDRQSSRLSRNAAGGTKNSEPVTARL